MQSATNRTHQPGGENDKGAKESEAAKVAVNQQVANAVVKGLSHFGAGPVVESLVYILELEHSVDLNSLSNNLDALRAALQKMFGNAAYVIETKIAESLARQLEVNPEGKKLDELVDVLRGRVDEFLPSEKKM